MNGCRQIMSLFLLLTTTTRAFVPTARRRMASSSTSIHAKANNKPRAKRPKNPYQPTIALPITEFSQRANAIIREPELQDGVWKGLYDKMHAARADDHEEFLLHDGPPYANGQLHIGHALNKVLKDFINRHQLLQGKRVTYVPGWDCHGLPIELKVLQGIKSKSERAGLTPVTLREKAATFAQDTVESQSTSFQRYGVYGDFANPYLTLQKDFEASQIDVFGKMFQQGYIFRGRKPVHWSPSSRTALAEAELEYPEGHVSKSIYVGLKVTEPSDALQEYVSDSDDDVRVAIWTTTPWTMPANMAVAVNPALEYSVVNHAKTGRLIVATDLVESLAKTLELEDDPFQLLGSLSGAELTTTQYQHPLYPEKLLSVVEGGDYITTESGTGLVHTAPGHGQEDYQTGLKHGLDLVSPVDDGGRFTKEAGEAFEGLNVLSDGNIAVIDALNASQALLKVQDYNHKYPYDWRTKKPTIFRATDQWFASVEGFRKEALDAIDTVEWVPAVGKNRIKSFVEGRGDWCISRQRSWGVPIPVFYHKETGEVLLNDETLAKIKELMQEHGSDCWWTMSEAELLPDGVDASVWTKGTDTMDVWFDSGSSWNGVVQNRLQKSQANLYLEGSDQHRGWFQSSLLTSVAARGQAPYQTVLTHGFVLDEKGFKMSKSLGNVVDPLKVIEGGNNKKKEPAYGADVLRMWVASVDYSGDVCIGDNIIKQTFESYRKLRNTARYVIGNLHDFDPAKDLVPYDELPSLDKYILGRLSSVLKEMEADYDNYQFNPATQAMLRFATADLSNFYLDVAKDRLYISALNDVTRRKSCQTVLHYILQGFMYAMAPVVPHMAEDIYQNLPYEKEHTSLFEGMMPPELKEFATVDDETWSLVRDLRDDVNQVLERARTNKLVGASLEAAAYVYVPKEEQASLLSKLVGDDDLIHPPVKTNAVDELRTVLMLSQVHLVDSADVISESCEEEYISTNKESGVVVGVAKAKGTKCARCWFYGEEVEEGGVCQRCSHAIKVWEETTGTEFVKEIPEEAAAPAS